MTHIIEIEGHVSFSHNPKNMSIAIIKLLSGLDKRTLTQMSSRSYVNLKLVLSYTRPLQLFAEML